MALCCNNMSNLKCRMLTYIYLREWAKENLKHSNVLHVQIASYINISRLLVHLQIFIWQIRMGHSHITPNTITSLSKYALEYISIWISDNIYVLLALSNYSKFEIIIISIWCLIISKIKFFAHATRLHYCLSSIYYNVFKLRFEL